MSSQLLPQSALALLRLRPPRKHSNLYAPKRMDEYREYDENPDVDLFLAE
jgi:hypothetical protein